MSKHSARVRQSLKAKTLHAQREAQRFMGAYALEHRLVEHQGRRLRALEDELMEAKIIAGRMSILFPATDLPMEGPDARDAVRSGGIMVEVNDDWRQRMAVADRFVMGEAIHRQTLPVLLADVRVDVLNLSTHVRVVFDDKSSGYALSAMSLRCLTPKQLEYRVHTMIAPDLARHLVSQIFPRSKKS